MTDLEPILKLWRELEASRADYVLATVVAVEGSSYRRPGARMILAQDGRRVGTVSGGCLEAEIARRAWWLTSGGPVVERFSTIEEDDERPYGSGCGGKVSILLERRATAARVLGALQAAFNQRTALAVATVLEGPHRGRCALAAAPCSAAHHNSSEPKDRGESAEESTDHQLQRMATLALEREASIGGEIRVDGEPARAWADYRPARPGLWIFGAGDDARPLLRLARELGWFVAIADGRSHLATRERFPSADVTTMIDVAALPGPGLAHLDLRPTDAAVVMTHSFDQDSRILAALLSRDEPLAYLGVLGPQRRTHELLAEAARLLDIPAHGGLIEKWFAGINAPTGLDLGAETPAAIALSILAEIQQTLNRGTGQPLRVVRIAKSEAVQS
jgi:xanthine dehydrogenase accessory factor